MGEAVDFVVVEVVLIVDVLGLVAEVLEELELLLLEEEPEVELELETELDVVD